MNKKIVVPIVVVLVLALLVVAILFVPNLVETALRMHGLR